MSLLDSYWNILSSFRTKIFLYNLSGRSLVPDWAEIQVFLSDYLLSARPEFLGVAPSESRYRLSSLSQLSCDGQSHRSLDLWADLGDVHSSASGIRVTGLESQDFLEFFIMMKTDSLQIQVIWGPT